mmetsp:Transcript_42597/g.134106  ORF Transcript_42597/g.134106 Transcript_42597/m.134106 type:complete len:207 (-) Transcript_42597:924-1544(-)
MESAFLLSPAPLTNSSDFSSSFCSWLSVNFPRTSCREYAVSPPRSGCRPSTLRYIIRTMERALSQTESPSLRQRVLYSSDSLRILRSVVVWKPSCSMSVYLRSATGSAGRSSTSWNTLSTAFLLLAVQNAAAHLILYSLVECRYCTRYLKSFPCCSRATSESSSCSEGSRSSTHEKASSTRDLRDFSTDCWILSLTFCSWDCSRSE